MAVQPRRPVFSTATANKAKPLPQFQRTGKAPANSQEFLASLDPLLKLNKGGFTAIGADTSSNRPYTIPGAEPVAVKEAADQQPIATPYNEGGDAYQFNSIPQNPLTGGQNNDNPSIDQFMNYLDQVLQGQGYGTPTAPEEPFSGAQGIASMPDGGVLFDDGYIRYDDGTQREYTGQQSQPIAASFPDGLTHYTDGTVRKPAQESYGIASMPGNQVLYNDQSVHYGPYQTAPGGQSLPGGTRGLISGIFGQDRTITQPYGNVNPIEPTPGHVNLGTDIRTRDLTGSQRELKLPVGATVVQVYQDDGTRFGDQSGHQGYGNSLLLQLPSGEMLRFSHLSTVLNVQPGDQIQPGEVFGTPGTTGNTDGQHLDLEYYNPQGQIDNPVNFTGFTNPQSILPNQPKPGSIVPESQRSTNAPGSQSVQPTQTPVSPAAPEAPLTDMVSNLPNVAAQIVNQVNPTGKAIDFGITENLQGDPAAAAAKQRETIANIGTAVGAPELQTNELSASQGTDPFRQLAGNLLDVASTPLKKLGVPDFGISEAVAGGKTVNTDQRLAPGALAYNDQGQPIASKAPTPGDYASVLGKNIGDAGQAAKIIFSNAVEKPLEGLGAIKDQFQSGVSNLAQGFGDALNKIGPKRAVGEESVGDTNLLGAPTPQNTPNDIRDPFFKLGGAETYGKFLNTGAVGDGGLSLDLFNSDFYKDPNNVANVFGSSHLLGPAQDKYKAFEAAKYPKMGHMGYADGYDNGAIDDYNKQIDEYNSSIDAYLNGINLATPHATYAETPRPTQSIVPGTNFSPNVSVSQQRAGANKNLFSNAFSLAPFSVNGGLQGVNGAQPPSMANIKAPTFNGNVPGAPTMRSMPGGPSGGFSAPGPSSPVIKAMNAPSGPQLIQRAGQPSQPAPKGYSVAGSGTSQQQLVPIGGTPIANRSAQLNPAVVNRGSTNIFSAAVNAVKRLFGR